MCLLTAKHHFGLSAVFIFIGFLVVQSASTFAQTLNTFERNTIADPDKVNANFRQLSEQISGLESLSSRVSRINQQLGEAVVVDCEADSDALLSAIRSKATNIEVVRGTCNANTKVDNAGEINEFGDLRISGLGSTKPILLTSAEDGAAGYLGGRGGRLELINVSLRGGIMRAGSDATLRLKDTDIECNNQNTVAIILFGGGGFLIGSTVKNCNVAAWLGSASSLLVQASTVELMAPSPISVGFSLVNGSVLELEDSVLTRNNPSPDEAFSVPFAIGSASHVGVTGSAIDGGGRSFISVNNGGSLVFNRAKVTGEVVDNALRDSLVGLSGASQFRADRTTFENVSIQDFGPYLLEDSATTAYLSSDAARSHANLTVSAGRQVVLAGAWLGENLRASVGQAGVVSVRNAEQIDGVSQGLQNDFRFSFNDGSGRGFDIDSTLRVQSLADLTFYQEDEDFLVGACKLGYQMAQIPTASSMLGVWQCAPPPSSP